MFVAGAPGRRPLPIDNGVQAGIRRNDGTPERHQVVPFHPYVWAGFCRGSNLTLAGMTSQFLTLSHHGKLPKSPLRHATDNLASHADDETADEPGIAQLCSNPTSIGQAEFVIGNYPSIATPQVLHATHVTRGDGQVRGS
jgi:hypothetical protein